MKCKGNEAGHLRTYSVPQAGAMADLGKNASYQAAKRGEMPVIRFGKLMRVPAEAWDRKLAGGESA